MRSQPCVRRCARAALFRVAVQRQLRVAAGSNVCAQQPCFCASINCYKCESWQRADGLQVVRPGVCAAIRGGGNVMENKLVARGSRNGSARGINKPAGIRIPRFCHTRTSGVKDTSKACPWPNRCGQHQRRRVASARANSCGRFNRSVRAAAKRIAHERALTSSLWGFTLESSRAPHATQRARVVPQHPREPTAAGGR